MNIDDLKTLVELVSERDIAELEVEDAGVKLKIKKTTPPPTAAPSPPVVVAPSVNAPPPPAPAPAEAASPASTSTVAHDEASSAASGATATPDDNSLHYIKSPMVGTFYRQPEPGAEPFAREGDTIKKGQVLCIIEAMKLMNEIESELHGEVVKVLVENGQSVQYGDALFAVRDA